MTENFEQTPSRQLQEIIALEKMRNNELQKYIAAALDRLSTASVAVGIFTPSVYMVANGTGYLPQFATIMYSVGMSMALHIYGRIILRTGLR